MKINKKLIAVIVAAVLLVLLAVVPIYSKQVEGCRINPMDTHKSLLFGFNKEKVDDAAQEYLDWSSQYDCETTTPTFGLYIL